MSFLVEASPLDQVSADWLMVGLWQDEAPTGAVAVLDSQLGGSLGRLRESGDLTGKANELTPLLDRSALTARRLLVVGLGPRKEMQSGDGHGGRRGRGPLRHR